MNYLLAISVGPVQEFIAAARRTRDLWYGSWLLSELSKACAKELRLRGAQLIFPQPDFDENTTVANKLLAVVENSTSAAIAALGSDCEKAIQRRLSELMEQSLTEADRALRPDGIDVLRPLANQQTAQLVEFYAAWQPMGVNYKDDRREVELRLAGRKALRAFPAHVGLARPKSSLDGVRESVLDFPKELKGEQFQVRRNEQLDAVGLLKRFGKHPTDGAAHRFDSTIDVAAVPYVTRLRKIAPAEYDRYREKLKAQQRFTPLSDGYLYPHESRQIEHEDTRRKIEELVAPLRRRLLPKPPYYVAFIGDGDNMGATIGELDRQGHIKFSQRLSAFADGISKIVSAHDGQAIYAGGDDVMALLPLHTALDCAKAIENAFNDAMKEFPEPPTFSAGMVVAHAMEPLSEVLEMARRAERLAKLVPGKRAIAVVAAPRSGANVEAAAHWEELIPPLAKVAGLYRSGKITRNFGHELRKLLADHALLEAEESLVPLARALARKKDAPSELLEMLETSKTRHDLKMLMNTLFLARPFAQGMMEAFGSDSDDTPPGGQNDV